MIKNGFYYCTKNDCIYHKTDEGLDVLVGWTYGEFSGWMEDYNFGLKPIRLEEVGNTMFFLGE